MKDSIDIVKLYSQEIMEYIYIYIIHTYIKCKSKNMCKHIYTHKEKFNRFCKVEIMQFTFTDHVHKII